MVATADTLKLLYDQVASGNLLSDDQAKSLADEKDTAILATTTAADIHDISHYNVESPRFYRRQFYLSQATLLDSIF
jgi:hypothetical protein